VAIRPGRSVRSQRDRKAVRRRKAWSWRIPEPTQKRKLQHPAHTTLSASYLVVQANQGTDAASPPNFTSTISPPYDPGDYDFLLARHLNQTILSAALVTAQDSGLMPHDIMIAEGLISEEDYVSALGSTLGLLVYMWDFALPESDDVALPVIPADIAHLGHWVVARGQWTFMLRATASTPRVMYGLSRDPRLAGWPLALAPSSSIDAHIEIAERSVRLDMATDGLKLATPGLSAGLPSTTPQRVVLWSLAASLIVGLLVATSVTLSVAATVLGIPFLLVTLMRLMTLWNMLWRKKRTLNQKSRAHKRLRDSRLPRYSVLVPLFREAAVLPDLIAALARLDYPAGKLEVLLVLEAIDIETHARLMTYNLPGHFRIIVVPDSLPRTKPKALNYALGLTHGDFVVVFDAEDRPDPGQLRDAVAAFSASSSPLACVQAQLNIYNPSTSWFSRQFTIEYSALFDAILPMLAAYCLPIPLGGTSNHFPRAVLDHLGGWDPYNVTEDADLGIRLARLGWRTTIIASTTWEEAPTSLQVWYPQRTRWLKGWMQTYLVHTRSPIRLSRDLGLRQSLGLHVYIAGLILSSLAHPLMYVVLIVQGLSEDGFKPPADPLQSVIWWGAWASLLLGYVTSIVIAALAVRRRHPRLAWSAIWMPVYWLMISACAYRAIWQLIHNPFLWEKTPHGQAKV
jgi:glycosyltransferase XagB